MRVAGNDDVTIARQRMLTLGNTEIEQGKFREGADVLSELDCRLAEDDASPDDTVTWEAIKDEAQARWNRLIS
jgi:hypothetical protein